MAATVYVAVFSIFVLVIYQLLQWRQTRLRQARMKRDHNCAPPHTYPHKDPIGFDYFTDNFKAFKELRLFDKYEKDFEKYGATFQVNQFGSPVIVSKEPAIVKASMGDDFGSWGVSGVRELGAYPFLGNSFFIIDGPGWKHGRTQTRPALAKNEYGDMPRLERHVQKFLDLLPRDGSTVNMKEPFNRLSSSFSTEYFLGRETNMLNASGMSEKDKQLLEAVELAMLRISTRSIKGRLAKILPVERDYLRACKIVHDFVDESVEEAIQRDKAEKIVKSEHRVFLDDMVSQTHNRKELRYSALTMYLGGTDTTSATLTGICWALARDERVVAKLRSEILEYSPGFPDLETLQQMKYLKAVVNESMRLYGITSGVNYRTANADTVLPLGGGPSGNSPLFVKKGTTLVMDYRSMHKDPRWWGADAAEFRPERWIEGGSSEFWAWQGFGGGPRKCPGQNLAFTNVCYIIVRLFQTFKSIQSRDERPWTENVKLAVESLYGAEVALTPA